MKLSEKILYCRKKAGWSQEALADKLGVSRQAVSKWETGEAEPELSKLKLLAAVFQVSTDWLLSQDAPPVEPEQETSASQSAQPVSSDWMDKLPGFLSRMVRRFGWLYGIYLALGGAGIGFIGFLARTMSRKMFQSFNSLISDPQLSFSYPGMDKLVLKDINMDVAEGEFVSILGQSGCGKSTLLRLLAGLEKQTSGEILIDGKPFSGPSLSRGVVFQDYGLFPWMTAGENIMLALRQRFPERDKKELREVAVNMLQSVGLDKGVYNKLPKELSGGMKQRCAIARAFGIDPPILLMDEPFGALDAVTRARLQDMVLELWRKQEPKKTVFFVTHDVDEAILLSTKIFVLGQSPSNVIFSCDIPSDGRPTRETQFDDPKFLNLRNTLIRYINQDVASRIS